MVTRAEFGEDYRDHDLIFCYVDGEPLRPDILSREFIKHAAAGFSLFWLQVAAMILGSASRVTVRRSRYGWTAWR